MARKNRIALRRFKGVYLRESTSNTWRGRPDKCYWILFSDSQTKKKRWEKCGWISEGWTPEAAQNRRNEILEQSRAGKYKSRKEQEKDLITLDELAEKYIEWAKINKKSWNDDNQRYNTHIKPLLANKPINAISPLDLEKLKSSLLKKKIGSKTKKQEPRSLSPATVKHCLVLIRQMINKAIAWGLFSGQNPIKQVSLPKLNNRRLRFLTQEEVSNLLENLQDVSSQVHDQAFLSLHTGMRFGEIAQLTLADLDFTNDIIQIRDPKGESRQAYMTDEVKEILLTHRPEQPTDLIFPDLKGNLQKSVSNTFDQVVKRSGLNEGITDRRDKVVFHTLRHTFASWLAINGTPIFTIKELMGHKSLAMTERYAHLIPDHKREAVNGLAKMFKGSLQDQKTSKTV